ncbi:Uncharacterised protein [Mycobacteroides abscessus subsp. massiliense]|nr:Uncharacterised protein [Mycobacteroides abscessus subsp. massiliense]
MTGTGAETMPRITRFAASITTSGSSPVTAVRSAPVQKALPAPVSTIARAPVASAPLIAVSSATRSSTPRAFMRPGRSIVM